MNLGDAKEIGIVVMQNFTLLGKLIFWIIIIQAMDGAHIGQRRTPNCCLRPASVWNSRPASPEYAF
ncbi:hypothetical protein MPL3365_170321 [Mesorhizobium plurifarium]|uniref:Uncharacterized protein n=1 Tax=Mesorhizobium plurifarium TaxID=69974 RepID=A0A090GTH5_MESPL|nr:hypothetical protein MPL3365_170321 [Mesorhizobium plurifarium]